MPLKNTTPAADRFWPKVDRATFEGCWEWTGARNTSGYGVFYNLSDPNPDLRDEAAHRFSYRLHFGPIPEGMCVCHTCDAPACVNPAHLFLGTNADNILDKVQKNRQGRGEQITRAHLTASQVVEARRRYAQGGISLADLASLYGITRQGMWEVIRRYTWKHI